MSFKPDGYPEVSPYLLVGNATAVLDFLAEVFGAERLRVIPCADDDGIMHAEARIGDSVIMMGEMPDAPGAHVHVYVEDVDAAFSRAEKAGGTPVQPPMRKGDGDYRGGITDPGGTTWWIACSEA